MELITESLMGLGNFALYFTLSIVFLFVFKVLYVRITPHDEWELVKEEKNIAAATGFAGAIVGFSIALSSAASHSANLIDFGTWGFVALAAQLMAFALLRYTFMPKIAERISNNEMSAGIMLAGMSVAVGLLNAACMSY